MSRDSSLASDLVKAVQKDSTDASEAASWFSLSLPALTVTLTATFCPLALGNIHQNDIDMLYFIQMFTTLTSLRQGKSPHP